MLILKIEKKAGVVFATVRTGNDRKTLMIAKLVPAGHDEGDFLQKVISDLSKDTDLLFAGDGVPTNYWETGGDERDISEAVQILFDTGFTFGAVYE